MNVPRNRVIGDLFMRQVQGSERGIPIERLHGKAASIQDILLADLDHGSAVRNDTPRLVQQVASQRVQDHIHALAARTGQNLLREGLRARREDSFLGDAELGLQEVSLLQGSRGGVNLRQG